MDRGLLKFNVDFGYQYIWQLSYHEHVICDVFGTIKFFGYFLNIDPIKTNMLSSPWKDVTNP